MIVELYSTEGCGHCAEAREMLQRMQSTSPLELHEVTLTPSHPRYAELSASVPVLVINQRRELKAPLDAKLIARLLREESPQGFLRFASALCKRIGVWLAVAGVALRLVGIPELGYSVFGAAVAIFGGGWILGRVRSRRRGSTEIPVARKGESQ